MNQKFKALEERIVSQYTNIKGVAIMHQDTSVYEHYFHEGSANDYYHIYSLTKSIVSILIGIAIDKGYIKDEYVRVADYFQDIPRNRRLSAFDQLRIEDILKMETPYVYENIEDVYEQYFISDDWVRFTIEMVGMPQEIGNFQYALLIGPDLLSAILTKATGKSVLAFAKDELFDPLGIQVKEGIHFDSVEAQMNFYQSTDMSGWVHDGQNVYAAGWGLTLKLTDLLKIGELCMHHGVYHNQRIVSASWLEKSTKQQSYAKSLQLAYGYLWWVLDENERIYAAVGDGSNLLYINESKQLIVCITGMLTDQANDVISLVVSQIEPLFTR
ncbi:CubicO group peptidase (beta-lactamase class C family) [Breznakia blatticola]|uniref:CubicO group peptidase (Beta-lactamase class C family) n=1 Tax=Breznakia blatticola TaxID=1754012 RepID=A0A4R8A3G4_9FIRM|nr:serine hydrolase [Breznakia blatticola]TDW25127.1 CubicO group peptidase (beta-lactamase class C family) [Breznakia blatticola]